MDYNDIIDTLVKTVLDAVYSIVERLPFDKSCIGVILKVEANRYTVAAFGAEYVIESSNEYKKGQRVAVTAPQNDFKHLFLTNI